MMLSDVFLTSFCLSRTSVLSREHRGLARLKLSHVTRTPLSRSEGQGHHSPGRFTHRGVNASGSCSGERGNVLSVGTYCFIRCGIQAQRAVRREALRRPQREERGGGILWRLPASSLLNGQYTMRTQTDSGCNIAYTCTAECVLA